MSPRTLAEVLEPSKTVVLCPLGPAVLNASRNAAIRKEFRLEVTAGGTAQPVMGDFFRVVPNTTYSVKAKFNASVLLESLVVKYFGVCGVLSAGNSSNASSVCSGKSNACTQEEILRQHEVLSAKWPTPTRSFPDVMSLQLTFAVNSSVEHYEVTFSVLPSMECMMSTESFVVIRAKTVLRKTLCVKGRGHINSGLTRKFPHQQWHRP